MPPPKQMPLQNIKAGRQPAGGAFDSQDAASGTGLGPPPGAKNKNLGELRMNSVMGTKSQDRIMAAEYKRSIEAVGKGGLAALSQDERQEDTGPSDKQKDRNPFWQHQASFSNFASIVDQGERQKIAWALSRLDEFANAHESLLGQGSQLTHSEMISGMLFDEEELVPVPPLTCTYFKKVLVESGTTKEARFGVKVYMTNRRLILMDAEVVRMPTLDDTLAPEDKTMFLRTRYEVQVQVGDRSWYYPVPLNQLKGVSLDIHYGTRASGYLSQRRPIYHIAVLATAGLALLYYTLQEILARTDSLGATYDEVSDNFDAAGDVVGKGENLNKDEEMFWVQLCAGLFLCGMNPLLFLYFKDYSKSPFKPRMQQSRQITFGIFDPLYQQQAVYYLDLDDRYSPTRIRDYLNRVQHFAPHIAGKVLNT